MTCDTALRDVKTAMDMLRKVRNDLGETLVQPRSQSGISDQELRQASNLHDRVSRAIDSYARG